MILQKTELAQKLKKIKGVVPKHTTMPIMQSVLVMDGCLIASNSEITVKAKIEGTDNESIIIPERAFDLIDNLPDGNVDISATSEEEITIKTGKIKNTCQTFAPELFPMPVMEEEGDELTIPAETILESMKRVAYAVSPQNSNALMTAMCLQASGGQLNFVGLDGHVLAWDKVDYEGEFELLIPKNAADKLKSLGLSGEVKIKWNKNSAIFITDEYEVYTRLIEGEYFKYQRMFNELPLHTVVSRMDLLDAITRAKMCSEGINPVIFELKGNILDLSIKDRNTNYQETVDLQEDIAEALKIGFNAKLVLETLKAFDCDNIGISLGGPKMPMIIEAEDSDFKTVVLPVAIN